MNSVGHVFPALAELEHTLVLIPIIATFRAIPVVCCLGFRQRVSPVHATRVLLVFALCAWLAVREVGVSFLLRSLAGYGYFAILAFGIAKLGTPQETNPTRPSVGLDPALEHALLVAVLFVLYVGVPATMFSAGSDLRLALMAWGWDRSLAAYSYLRRGRDSSEPNGGVLFFLFANPELVFPGHAKACPPHFALGAARAVWGAFLLAAVGVFHPVLAAHPASSGLREVASIGLQGASAIVWLYAAHSGLAHLQIGLLKVLGVEIPERYRYPLLAGTPREFWTRWNMYMASWVRVYLYLPIARGLAAKGLASRSIGTFAGVLAFASVGVLHAVYSLADGSRLGLRSLGCFATWGVLFVVFDACERRLHVRDATWQGRRYRMYRVCARVFVVVFAVLGARAIVA